MPTKDLTVYSKQDLEKAKTKGQVLGWVQGAGIVAAGWFLLGLVGWIPLLLIGGVAAFVGYKLLSGPPKPSPGDGK